MGERPARDGVREIREGRVSETRLRIDGAEQTKTLTRTRDQARTMRNQGWVHEMVGRQAAFTEAAELVEKWLGGAGGPTKEGVAFVVELLEQSAKLYSPRTKTGK